MFDKAKQFVLIAGNYQAARTFCDERGIDPRHSRQVVIVTKDSDVVKILGLDRNTQVVLGYGYERFNGMRDVYARFNEDNIFDANEL